MEGLVNGWNPTQSRYVVRFIRHDQVTELINLWHTARVPCGLNRHARMIQASEWFSAAHPETSPMAAYKDLDGLLG